MLKPINDVTAWTRYKPILVKINEKKMVRKKEIIAEFTEYNKMYLYNLIEQLEKDRYIESVTFDGKEKILHLTRKGEDILKFKDLQEVVKHVMLGYASGVMVILITEVVIRAMMTS